MPEHITRMREAIEAAPATRLSVIGVPVHRARQHLALADAVTRLEDAMDLASGLMLCRAASGEDRARAWIHYTKCVNAVLAARAALDVEEG